MPLKGEQDTAVQLNGVAASNLNTDSLATMGFGGLIWDGSIWTQGSPHLKPATRKV